MIYFSPLLWVYLSAYLLRSVLEACLAGLNMTFLRKTGFDVPEPFRDTIDRDKLRKISAYTIESERFSLFADATDKGVFLILLLSGLLPRFAEALEGVPLGEVGRGLLFMGSLSTGLGLVHIPFDLYETFVIERRYGFSTTSWQVWLADLAKSTVLSGLLGAIVLGLLLALAQLGGRTWWIWAWMAVGTFELLLMWLFPVVIAPLFNRFEPVREGSLVEGIRSVLAKAGLRVRDVLKMDASRRSRHTNAYFTGVGRTKRIVLYDTLLASHPEDEILSVVAHEAGHWKRRHVLKQILLLEGLAFLAFWIVARLMAWPELFRAFGFRDPLLYLGLFAAATLMSPAGFFLRPFQAGLSRRFEIEADAFALRTMGTAEPMIRSLKRLTADNLSNLVPHPLYAWFYFSHPPVLDRIQRLKKTKE
jgi:STE24 endopeptidase